jgi:hypothetical protein
VFEILQPWSLCLDLDATSQVDSQNKEGDDDDALHNLEKVETNRILELLSEIERNMALIYTHRNLFEISEGHCQRALFYANRYDEEGEIKNDLLKTVLITYVTFRKTKGDLGGELFAEGVYNYITGAYNTVHPQMVDGDDAKTEHSALLMDQKEVAVAKGIDILAGILEGELWKVAKELYQHSLAIYVKVEGLDGVNTAVGNTNLGHFYFYLALQTHRNSSKKREYLQHSIAHFEETFRIYSKIFDDPYHDDTVAAASRLMSPSRLLSNMK